MATDWDIGVDCSDGLFTKLILSAKSYKCSIAKSVSINFGTSLARALAKALTGQGQFLVWVVHWELKRCESSAIISFKKFFFTFFIQLLFFVECEVIGRGPVPSLAAKGVDSSRASHSQELFEWQGHEQDVWSTKWLRQTRAPHLTGVLEC